MRQSGFWKKMTAAAAALAGMIGMTSCSNLEHPLKLPRGKKVSVEQFNRLAVGHAWKHVSTYEIRPDGSVKQKEFYEGMCGGGPVEYYFKTAGQMYRFVGNPPFNPIYRDTYSYKDNRLCTKDGTDEYFEILGLDEQYMHVKSHLGFRDGKNDLEEIWGYTTYQKMTEQELEEEWRFYRLRPGDLPFFLSENEGEFLHYYETDFSDPMPDATGPYHVEKFFKVVEKDGKHVLEPYYLVDVFNQGEFAFKSKDAPATIHMTFITGDMVSNITGKDQHYYVLRKEPEMMHFEVKGGSERMQVLERFSRPEIFRDCPEASLEEIDAHFYPEAHR